MKYISLLIAALILTSCYREEEIQAELGLPRYTIEDSDDPLDHAIYEMYRTTGMYILYNYELNDYLWDLGSLYNSSNRLIMQTDRTVLLDGLHYLDAVLFDIYPVDFQKKYFPLKIFLADTINMDGSSTQKDLLCGSGREYLAVGKIRADGIPTTDAELLVATGRLSAYLWAYIIKNGTLVIPPAFAEISRAFYGKNYKAVKAEQQGTTAGNIPYPTLDQLMDEGFWAVDPNNTLNFPVGGNYAMMPPYEGDIFQFVEAIVTHTEAEMIALMDGHEKLKAKYDILVQAIKEQCDIDLQAIGK
jgi:hypothetical protein